MKVFHRSQGHKAGETMTVAELRAKLATYPDEMPVFGTWESVCGYITDASFVVEAIHKGTESESCDCLLIDVEGY